MSTPAATEQQLNDATKFAAYVTVCAGALFFAGVNATFLS
jgi:hypothetical protein